MDVVKAFIIAVCFVAVIFIGNFIALFLTALNDINTGDSDAD